MSLVWLMIAISILYVYMTMPRKSFAVDLVVAILLADFISAFFHWFEDAYYSYNQNVFFVSEIAKENELHHYRPRGITYNAYVENMIPTMVGSAGILAVLCMIIKAMGQPVHMDRLLMFFFFASLTNLVHRFQHEKDCERPALITFLQSWLLVSRDHHKQHHATEHNDKFGVFLKGTNTIYDTLGVWRGFEWFFYVLFGEKPQFKSYYTSDYDNDAIITSETNCNRHTDAEIAEWRENLASYHELR
jgi:Lipid desaturase domain